jgi:hypothetical protein
VLLSRQLLAANPKQPGFIPGGTSPPFPVELTSSVHQVELHVSSLVVQHGFRQTCYLKRMKSREPCKYAQFLDNVLLHSAHGGVGTTKGVCTHRPTRWGGNCDFLSICCGGHWHPIISFVLCFFIDNITTVDHVSTWKHQFSSMDPQCRGAESP